MTLKRRPSWLKVNCVICRRCTLTISCLANFRLNRITKAIFAVSTRSRRSTNSIPPSRTLPAWRWTLAPLSPWVPTSGFNWKKKTPNQRSGSDWGQQCGICMSYTCQAFGGREHHCEEKAESHISPKIWSEIMLLVYIIIALIVKRIFGWPEH